MGLRINRPSLGKSKRLIVTVMAVFALMIQPGYGFTMGSTEIAGATPFKEVVYNSLMSTEARQNYGSYGVQAHGMSEFGDRVLLGGSARQIESVSFNMSNWALAEDRQTPSVEWCQADLSRCTNEGFIYPMTSKVYSGDLELLGSVTQDVHIPWRPAGHPDCDLTSNGPSGDRDRGWKDAEGKCVNVSGIPFTADFNFSGEGIVVPHDAIFSITMNTRQYGDAPTGGRAPIDKVNVGLNGNTSAVAVGQDQNPGAFYLRYGSPEFREIAWGQPYNLGIKVTATTDGVAPEVKVNLNGEAFAKTGSYVNQNKNPEIQASDETSLDRVELYKSGSDTPSHVWRHGDRSTRAKIGFLRDGQYTIVAHDKSGNASKPFVVNLDSANPETTFVAPAGLTGNIFTVSGEAKDNVSLNRVYVQLVHRESNTRYGGTTINLISHGTGPYTWERTYDATKMNLPEGTYAAHVTVVDRAGNSSSEGWTDDFILDKTMPSFEIKSPKNGSAVSGKQRVEVEITDDNDIQKVLLNVGDGHGSYVWEQGKSSDRVQREGNIFYLDVDTTTLTEGVNHVVVRATDGAGNTRYYNNRKNVHSYTVDNTKPALQAQLNSSHINGSSLSVDVSASDATSGVDRIEYKITDLSGNPIKGHGYTTNPLNNGANTIDIANLGEESYMLYVRAIDKADNKTHAPIITFTVDRTEPRITNILSIPTQSTMRVVGETDDTSDVTVTLGGFSQTVTPVGGAWEVVFVDLEPGAVYPLSVYSADRAGNVFVSSADLVATTLPATAVGGELLIPEIDDDRERTDGDGDRASLVRGFASISSPSVRSQIQQDQDEGEVLGSRNVSSAADSASILGAADVVGEDNVAGGKLLGVAWYWWVVILAVIGAAAWMVAAALRNRREDAELGF